MSDLHYGMDADLRAKELAKYNENDKRMVVRWVSAVSGKSADANSTDLLEWLHDGTVLVALANKMGGTIKANESTMPFKQMENIANFLRFCRERLGMKENDLFTSADLYDGKSVVNVINGMISVSRAAAKNGFVKESIAPREASSYSGKHHDLSNPNSGVSKLNTGSAGIMDKSEISYSNNIDFGAKSSSGKKN